MRELKQVARFASAHYPPARDWPKDRMYQWLKWAAFHKFLAVIMDYHRPVGVLFARPVSDLLMAEQSGSFDLGGDILYIDLAIARDKETLRCLGGAALNNLGLRKQIAYKLQGRGPIKVRDMKKTLTALFHNG